MCALEQNVLQVSRKLETSPSAGPENIEPPPAVQGEPEPGDVLTMDSLYTLEKEMLQEVTTSTPAATMPSRHSVNDHKRSSRPCCKRIRRRPTT